MDLFGQPRTAPVPTLSAERVASLGEQRSHWKGWASILMTLVCMPAGLVLGILALRQARRDGDRPLRTLGILGTVLNAVALAVVISLVATGVIGGGGIVPVLRLDTLGGSGLPAAPARSAQLSRTLRAQLVAGFASLDRDVAVGPVRCRPGRNPLRYTCDTLLESRSDAAPSARVRLAVTTTAKGRWSVVGAT
jgi:hypothetical protein